MQVQKIKISNFKSIYEPLELNFTQITGFWIISGSVGSGKTTIGEAIIFGLFGSVSGKNNSDLLSWGEKHGLVEIWCVSKSRNIYIKRELNAYGQNPIYVEIDGEELVFTNKRDAQSQLEQEYYDTSKVTIELLCIISFNNFKSLATLNSQDTKKFLDQVLGFYALTQYADKCKELKIKNLHDLSVIRNNISNLQSQKDKLEELSNKSILEGNIHETRNAIKELETRKKDTKKQHKIHIEEFNKIIDERKKTLSSIITLGKNITKEIAFIEKGTCPTCGAPIDQSQLESKKQEKKILEDSYKDTNNHIKTITGNKESAEQEWQRILEALEQEIIYNNKILTQLEEQEKRLSINLNEINEISNKIASQSVIEDELKREDAKWDILYDILSTQVRAKIMSSFIPILNKNITKYVQRLHLPYLVQFDHNFKCNISICGFDQDISISSLSTGQLKTVDMVVILGVLGTIIGSNGINILFLDELFSNLDMNLRGEMCQLLKETVKPDTTTFIISHTELEDRYFDGNIHMRLEPKQQYGKYSNCTINYYNEL